MIKIFPCARVKVLPGKRGLSFVLETIQTKKWSSEFSSGEVGPMSLLSAIYSYNV